MKSKLQVHSGKTPRVELGAMAKKPPPNPLLPPARLKKAKAIYEKAQQRPNKG